MREVYATEAYDVDGYRFRLPPGRYHVVIRAKWGYGVIFDQPNPAVFCEYKVNGRSVAGMIDFYKAQKGELKNVLNLSCDAAVGADGILEITLNTPGAKSARLINAIEITRQ